MTSVSHSLKYPCSYSSLEDSFTSDKNENCNNYNREIKHYQKEGYVFPVERLFSDDRLTNIDDILTKIVENRPTGLPSEDLLNLHFTCKEILELCMEPSCLFIASKLLGTTDLSVFTSRILCKLPHEGKEIPWHQDALYWPLEPPMEGKHDFDKLIYNAMVKYFNIYISVNYTHNLK